jgi:outer membrane protein assembly factor BamA
VEKTPGRYLESAGFEVTDPDIFDRKTYGGVHFQYLVDKRDNKMIPSEGIVWNFQSGWNKGLNAASNNYGNVQSSLSLYWSTQVPSKFTVAARVGGGINWGDTEFFQAQTLGGNMNLRGFRKTRFAGDAAFYNNLEIRFKLFNFKSYLFPSSIGFIGFKDVGRVWVTYENSKTWHHGYGGGFWISPMNEVIITAVYTMSKELRMPWVKLGFFF